MHYNLLFNGCSWTYGSELEGIHKDREHQRTHRFSHLVAENLGMTYDNISKSGSNNDWITEKTIEWFETGNTCDIAIIQFTIDSRTNWYDDNEREYFIGPSPSSYYPRLNSNKNIKKSVFVSNLYYKTFYSDIIGRKNRSKNLYILNQYLKNKNSKLIILDLPFTTQTIIGDKSWEKLSNINAINICELLGYNKNYGKKTNINPNYCIDLMNKQFPHHTGTHPNELGHQKIANYLIEEINNAL